jgi:hypothetical protein
MQTHSHVGNGEKILKPMLWNIATILLIIVGIRFLWWAIKERENVKKDYNK